LPSLPLVMDESFSNLDADNIAAIRRIIHEDNNQWIIVSHDERLL
jgi:DNA repair exonuclease SbcCD ATPase subunit